MEIGQEQLEKNYKELLGGQKELQQNVKEQGKDIKGVKQDVVKLDLKIEVFNSKMEKETDDIINGIGDSLEIVASQKQVDNLDHRVKILEKKVGVHN